MDKELFLGLPEYLSQITDQVALGGGEPMLYPKLVYQFSKLCNKYDLICNLTTNATHKVKPKYLKYLTMISLSWDNYKIRDIAGIRRYDKMIQYFNNLKIKTGSNFLLHNESIFKNGMDDNVPRFMSIVKSIFNFGVERVFTLYPKNWKYLDILKYRDQYLALSLLYEHFYVDDLTNQILSEKKYSKWSKSCHYGKDIISINEEGYVTGCSFDPNNKAVLKIQNSKDILNILDIQFKERFSCPYLNYY